MLILFNHGTPRGIAQSLIGHTVVTAYSQGWATLSNGSLLAAAEEAGFDLFLTTDQRIQYQQNLSGRKIAIVVVTGATKWSQVQQHLERVRSFVDAAAPSSYYEVLIPFKS